MARVSIFLIVVALIAGMVGCGQPKTESTPMVAAGGGHTVGLKSDGTVVAVGRNGFGQCNVAGWSNITQVAAGTEVELARLRLCNQREQIKEEKMVR